MQKMNPNKITAACAFVFDNNRNILAIKKHRGWDIPGGKVQPGEYPEKTVIRETSSETSVIVDNPYLFHIQEFDSLDWKIAYYRCNVIEIYPFKNDFETTERNLCLPKNS